MSKHLRKLLSLPMVFMFLFSACDDQTKTGPEGCLPGQSDCGGQCVDLEHDRANCGRCGYSCAQDQPCYGGQCVTCQDECTAQQTRCDPDGTAAVETCAQVDSDPCQEWAPPQPCPSGHYCQDGQCIEGCLDECPGQDAQECSGSGYVICGEYDQSDECLEWSAEQACPEGHYCQDGQCLQGCQNECPARNARECRGEGYVICSEYDQSDPCLEWSTEQECPALHECNPADGQCLEACGDFCDDFSVILLPDTQYYTSKRDDNADLTYYKQMQWIIDNEAALNIKFVIHLGDITNNNTIEQWAVAHQAHQMLDAANIPYSMVPGNHDYLTSDGFSRGDTMYADYFSPDRFAGKSWYGGSRNTWGTDNYTYFQVGDLQFMVLSLEYAPRKESLCWAEEVLEAHPDHRVIVVTHCYLTHNGAYGPNCPDSSYDVTGSDGATVWGELVSRHSNIFMVLSGHIGDSEYVPREGNNANTVHQIVVDYQFEARCTAASQAACNDHCQSGIYTGNGWLRQMTFSPRQNRIVNSTHTVEAGNSQVFPGGVPGLYCSPHNDQGHNWYQEESGLPDHQFQFDYDLYSKPAYAREDLAQQTFNDLTVNSAGSGDQLIPVVAIGEGGAFVVAWEDDSDSSDGTGNHDIMVRGFGPGGCQHFADQTAHTELGGQQKSPALGMDQQGNTVVAWADDRDGNGSFQIRARGFGADGNERLAEFTVNSQAAGQQLNPAVAVAGDGRFAVAWEDDQDNDGNFQVMVRGFNADGSQSFADLSANENQLGQHINPSIAMDSQGRFVVAWQDDSDGNGSYQIHARAFAADGSQRLPRFTVNSVPEGQQLKPSLGMDDSGNFALAWEDDQDNNGTYQILARGFNLDGSERFSDMTVNSVAAGQQLLPSLSMAPNGRFSVSWQDDADGNDTYQIKARGFQANGGEWFSDLTVNRDGDGQQLNPHAALNNSDTLVVVWQDDMDNNTYYQIVARGLDGDSL